MPTHASNPLSSAHQQRWTQLRACAAAALIACGSEAQTGGGEGGNGAATTAGTEASGGASVTSTSAVSGGSGSVSLGFEAEPGFSVRVGAEGLGHDTPLVITRSAGAFAPRAYSEHPWLYDVGDVQYVDGMPFDAMAGLGEGSDVPPSVPDGVWGGYGSDAHRVKLSRGARVPPNEHTQAWWFSTTGAPDMKTVLGDPLWPSAWNGGTQNNRRLYVSWWFRMKFAYQGGDPFRGKYLRYNATDGSGIGAHQINPDTLQHSAGTMYDIGPTAADDRWFRNEVYIDLDADAVDAYSHYRYVRQREMTGTSKGPHEFRRDDNFLYTLNPGGNVPFTEEWSNLTVGSLGFDGQGGDAHVGQEHDVANVYVDTEWQRFEISDSAQWDIGPNPYGTDAPGIARELQGRWRRISDTTAELHVNQGQFASLSGKYLWYVDGLTTATRIGRFE